MKLKSGILLTLLASISLSLNAQGPGMSRNNPQRPNVERVKAIRVAVLTEKMNLSTEEAEKFWPVYNEYEREQKKIKEKFQPNKDILSLDDAAVEKHLFGMLDMEEELVKLKKKYYQNFSKMVGSRKVAILAKSDREFNFAMIERLRNQSKKGK
ncbi:MAG: hypothetical protein RLZZ417_362 [Bacteroidota bacterium]|jgi:hypothetical protein